VRPDEPHSVQINVRVSPQLRRRIRQFCLDNDVEMKSFAALALEEGLRKGLRVAPGRSASRRPATRNAKRTDAG
jgi:hypothetical protein